MDDVSAAEARKGKKHEKAYSTVPTRSKKLYYFSCRLTTNVFYRSGASIFFRLHQNGLLNLSIFYLLNRYGRYVRSNGQ